MQFNIPTCFTFFRLFLVPFFVLAFYIPFYFSSWLTALIFIFASITDWIDGFLARRLKQTTHFGAFLDPIADKIMVVIALTLVVEYYHSSWVTLPTLIMISREIVILALRECMAEFGKPNTLIVSWIAKIKTMIQMFSLSALLWRPNDTVIIFGVFGLYVAVILTFWSMFQYLKLFCLDVFKY